MAIQNAADLAQLMNGYSLQRHPRAIIIPQASVLASLRDITVSGMLLHKRLTHIEADGSRTFSVPSRGHGAYVLEGDGDVHFCLGTVEDAVHVACELQHAVDWLDAFNLAIGNQVTASGFFRCLFEHPGFERGADAHVFELHPVRALDFGDGNGIQPFDVDVPDPQSTHGWKMPYDLNYEDAQVTVTYDPASDTLIFRGMGLQNTNYVQVPGQVSNIAPHANSNEPSQCTFTSDDIDHPITVYCLKGTSAARSLEGLQEGKQVTIVGLRNIDLTAAMQNHYVINMLAIDIQPT